MPPSATYTPLINPPPRTTQYPPAFAPSQYNAYGRGGTGRRPMRGGRSGRGRYAYPIAAPPLPSTGNIPPPGPNLHGTYTPNRGNTSPNPQKWYNNWNYCYTCGFDIKQGHTSATCAYPNTHHQPTCTRTNVDQYAPLGHRPSFRARHKINLPINPGPHQA